MPVYISTPPTFPIYETLEWATDILESWDGGREQRICLRQHPRRQLRMTWQILNDADLRAWTYFLEENLDRFIFLPLWHYATKTEQPYRIGDDTIAARYALTDIREGDKVLLIAPGGGGRQLLDIKTANWGAGTWGSFLLDHPLEFDAPRGSTLVPCFKVLAKDASGPVMSANQGTITLGFKAWDLSRPVTRPAAAKITPRTREKWPISDEATLDEVKYGYKVVDFGGARFLKHQWKVPKVSTTRVFRADRYNSADWDWWGQFLDKNKGSQTQFLFSTYREDLKLSPQNVFGQYFADPNAANVRFIGREYFDAYHSDRKDLYKYLHMQTNGPAGGESLFLNCYEATYDASRDCTLAALGTKLKFLKESYHFSFYRPSRLANDRVEMVHYGTYTYLTLETVTGQG